MRVISGQAKGRVLLGPKSDRIRPALDKIKGAIFNILWNILGNIEGAKVLDLFAGTGSIGIEAISRGASEAVFVDEGTEALQLIRKNLVLCRFENRGKIIRLPIPRQLSRLKNQGPFQLIFVDPPYDKDLVNPTLRAINKEKILAPDGIIIVEHSPRELIEEVGLSIIDSRKYGQTLISFLKG